MIIGAGFAGLIAAHVMKREKIFDGQPEPSLGHNALLRFRSDVVSRLTGISFRKVTVHKGIFFAGQFVEPNIHVANAYSLKCLGKIFGDRSIWNLSSVERFIAPENFYEQLLEGCHGRVTWNAPIDFTDLPKEQPIISTAPLHIPANVLAMGLENAEFLHSGISVLRFRVPDIDVHQTVYFPEPKHTLYRASITGDMLICEFRGDAVGEWAQEVQAAFCLFNKEELKSLGGSKQRYGKIAPIDEILRKRLIHDLTAHHGIFSIGRFATWRNILLDDVVKDAEIVKQLIGATGYDRRLAGA